MCYITCILLGGDKACVSDWLKWDVVVDILVDLGAKLLEYLCKRQGPDAVKNPVIW